MWLLFRNSYKMRDFCLLSPQKKKKNMATAPAPHTSLNPITLSGWASQRTPGEQTTLYIGLRGNAMGPGQNTSPL